MFKEAASPEEEGGAPEKEISAEDSKLEGIGDEEAKGGKRPKEGLLQMKLPEPVKLQVTGIGGGGMEGLSELLSVKVIKSTCLCLSLILVSINLLFILHPHINCSFICVSLHASA